MRILIVCGAGASSTFVALRLRQAARLNGMAIDAVAGSTATLDAELDAADLLLVGPHIAADLPAIEARVRRGMPVVVLPDDVFADLDGSRTLAQVCDRLAASEQAAPSASPVSHSA